MKNYWHSLRFRFSFSAVLLACLIIIASVYAISAVNRAQTFASDNLKSHANISEKLRYVRASLQEGYAYIDAFLLDPEKKKLKDGALGSIEKCILTVKNIHIAEPDFVDKDLENVSKLYSLLESLRDNTDNLFRVRQNAILQYPSLSIGNDLMQPNRNNFNNSIALALNELNEDSVIEENPSLYNDFITARHLWTQVLSNFRLYLANRVGSFDISALAIQESSIETMYLQLETQLKKLEQFDTNGELGFQASESVQSMLDSSVNWYKGFQLVKDIHRNEDWRIDSKIMREDIVPLINQISATLNNLETHLNNINTTNIGSLSESSNTVILILVWLSILFFVFLAGIFVSTDRLVFRPIATVVKALKIQGTGKENLVLPENHSKETEELFDSFTEMSRRVQQRQNDLQHQALHDALTSLPNRTLLHDRVEHNIQISRRENRPFALILTDLDQFKDINDTLGHHVGDSVLVEVGSRFKKVLRGVDTVARLGGDEYAILLPEANEEEAINVCIKLRQAMLGVFEVNKIQLYVNSSFGIACFPQHGEDVSSLIQHADVAMYDSKRNKLDYAIYDELKDNYSIHRLELINDLRVALDNDSLELHFQPLKSIRLGKVVGVESLLRWNHPVHGNLSPIEVIDLAEHTGLINPLTYWVIERAIRDGGFIQAKGYDLFISINISVYNLKDPEFIHKVKNIIGKSNINPSKLMFEITESAMMANPVHAINILEELNNIGIKIAVDDFGTGFSSLAYLKQMPVDEIKIDKSFVLGMQNNQSDEVIVRSTIDLAHNLGLEVIAEGVETGELYLKLKELGCDTAQGYLFSRPVNIEQLHKKLLDKEI